jgi:hypothetical protein
MQMVGDNTARASRINSIVDRYYKNIASTQSFKDAQERVERLMKSKRESDWATAGRIIGNAYSNQVSRRVYMGLNGG